MLLPTQQSQKYVAVLFDGKGMKHNEIYMNIFFVTRKKMQIRKLGQSALI